MRPLCAALVLAALSGCNCGDEIPRKTPRPAASVDSQAGPTEIESQRPSWAELSASDASCEDCHPDEVDAFRDSPMGHSAGPVVPTGKASVMHPLTGVTYAVDGATFSSPHESHVATASIGSGAHTRSFLWRWV